MLRSSWLLSLQAVNTCTHPPLTHLFVPETHLAGRLIVVFVSSPSGHRHTGLEKTRIRMRIKQILANGCRVCLLLYM